jgi:TonB-linked SusC/RagA family outer membrane protein
LQGILPGVTITSASGQPGNPGISIIVRGVNTINSSTGPLILIDGVSGGDINLMNPDDIESVSVLKDAASSAIYGARAANGVILVTTKKGQKKEKTSLGYNGYFGVQTPVDLPELVNGRRYMTLANEAYYAAGIAQPFQEDAFMRYDSKNFPNDYSDTDWIDASFKSYATQQNHNFNVDGGTDKSFYRMSYGYLDQKGLVVGDNYASTRNNVRMRLSTEVFDRIKLDGNIGYIDFYRKDPGSSGTSGVFRLAQRISPLLPVKWQQPTADGLWEDTSYWSFGSVVNPVRTAMESGYVNRKSKTFNANFNADIALCKGMSANVQYAYNYWMRNTKTWHPTQPRYYADGTPHPNNETVRNSVVGTDESTLSQTVNATLNYDLHINKHNIKVMAGYSQEWAYMTSLSATRYKILLDGVEEINAGTEDITNSGTANHWALMSYFGRLNYDFAEKYLFEANVRYDGTSRFAKTDNNRWGLFPSFSAGWKFSEEGFMAFAKPMLTLAKFRISWGELGNQTLGSEYYPYTVEIERQEKSYPIGGGYNVGFKQNKLANEMIMWETLRDFNLGLDLAALNNRLEITLEWFKKKNIGALLKPIYPAIVGITDAANLPYENMGEIENRGWDISIGWRDNIGKVGYGFTAILSDAQNKITKLGKSAPSLGNNIRREGDPINAYYGYTTGGLLQASDFEGYNEVTKKYEGVKVPVLSAYAAIVQPGDVKYLDVGGADGAPDGKIDDYDKKVFGNPYPRYTYSFKGFVDWNHFDFSFYLQGVGNVNGYLTEEARHCFINDYSVPKTAHLDRWTPNNPNAAYPRMYYNPSHNIVFSDYWLENASYMRLKNVQLGYSIPRDLLRKINVNRLKFYFSADNLLTLTKYFGGFDPEVRETAGDSYPQMKTFSFGLQLGF